jgi:aquaporin Z
MNFYKYLAEFAGTFALVMVILVSGNPFIIAPTIILIIYIIYPVSGGHINPAYSCAMVSLNKLDTELLVPYVGSQILGGLAAVEVYNRFNFMQLK